MTEIKTNDIVKIESEDEDLHGTFLVSSIRLDQIVLKAPPDREYTLTITDGVIEHVSSITVIHSAKVSGYADRMGYTKDKRICMTFVDGVEECGLIRNIEQDTIDIELDNGTMIYIDFEFEGIPEGILTIRHDETLQIEEVDEYYIFPENKHRFPLASQMIDLMDSLIKQESVTTKRIKEANLIVKRFRELKTLFSTEEGTPRILPSNYKPFIHPHEVSWIIPRVSVKRQLFDSPDASRLSWKEIEQLQTGRGSYSSIYKQILEKMTPYYNDLKGTSVQHTIQTVLSGNFITTRCREEEPTYTPKSFIPQVINAPYTCGFTTASERVVLKSYYSAPSKMEYTKLMLPQTRLLNAISIPYTRPDYSNPVRHLSNCVPEMSSILSHLEPFTSFYEAIRHVEPYLVYMNDVSVQYTALLSDQLEEHLESYKKRSVPPAYVYTPPMLFKDTTYGIQDHTASEWYMRVRREDQGRLFALTLQSATEMEYLHSLKETLHMEEGKGIPLVAKQYATLDAVRKDKGKTIFWDKNLDTTNYAELEHYPTETLLMDFLVDIKEMSIPLAIQYAPHFLNKKKVVLDGDYAKLNTTYFKRISNEWILDETCNGPYACGSNEPDCTECVDITFRLNENTKHAILSEYTELPYTNDTARVAALTKSMDASKINLKKMAMLRHMKEYRYNDAMLPLRESVLVSNMSIHQPLFLFILQKPYFERYKELADFIHAYTRPPGSGESETWLYCSTTNTPLVPMEYTQLIEVYASPEKYEAYIQDGLIRGIIKRDDENYILRNSGYPVGPIAFSQVFDDLVRSSELNEESLFNIPRLIHEDTPVIIQLLSEIGNLAKIPMTRYFNFIVREMDKQPKYYVPLSIAYMFKIASIVYTFNVSDGIDIILKKQDRLFAILERNGFKEDMTLTDKMIMSSILTVSSKFAIQQLTYYRERKIGRRTTHTIWNTFLPPIELTTIKSESVHPMNILILLQEEVQSMQPLRPGNHKVNTCKCTFQNETIQKLIRQYPTRRPIRYTQDILFFKEGFIPKYEDSMKSFSAFKMQHKDSLTKKGTDYIEKMTTARKKLNRCIHLPDDFFSPTLSLQYLKEFILLISVAAPEMLKNGYAYTLEISPVIQPMLSRTHTELLKRMTDKHYFNTLQRTFPDSAGLGLQSVIESVEVKEMLKEMDMPMHENSVYEMYYYIYRIFHLYVSNSDVSKSCVLIEHYINLFMEERSIFLSYEEIHRRTVKIKTKESNDRRLKLVGLSTEDKAIYQFREQNNLDPEARIGRLRTYNADAFESLYAVFHSDETAENGTDGNYDADE